MQLATMTFVKHSSLLLLCALTVVSAYGAEVNDLCKANDKALIALRSAAVNRDPVEEDEELFELNQPQRVKVAKAVRWAVAEALIRRGLVRSIEQPTKSRQFIFFGISGTKYSSTYPAGAHPYAIAEQVDPCGMFISLQSVD
ncbi:hypothetical protein [Roseateles sp. LYH14W]|uniref:Uncharacterized protein n=1 Tax=Pelomonas parva TaxID=3299032 RepID=A0ABW7FAP9_9BURK